MCYGITNGCLHPIERDIWIADFRRDPIVCERSKDLYLCMPGYDKSETGSRRVEVVLRRRGQEIPIWCGVVNSADLMGLPRLVFGNVS